MPETPAAETPATETLATETPAAETTIVVRAATSDDAPALNAVAAATFALACPPGTTDDDIAAFIAENLSVARMRDYLADPARALFLAMELTPAADVPVGYTMIVAGEPDDADVARAIDIRPTIELSKCYVLPGHHGAGVARDLVEASVSAAAARGARSVWLGVNQLNARANGFYAKSGFALVGTKRFLVGSEWHDDFVRERRLA